MNNIEKRVIELCKEYKKNNGKYFYDLVSNSIEKEFGIKLSNEKIRRLSRKYRKDNFLDSNFEFYSPDDCYTTTISSNGRTTTSEVTFYTDHNTVLTPDMLLEKHGFDKNMFELISVKNSKWVQNKKGVGLVDLYSSKITVKPKVALPWTQDNIDNVLSNIKIKQFDGTIKDNSVTNNKYLVVPISDLHLGLLSEKNITGSEYNLEIAENLYYYVISDVINEVRGQSFEKVIFILGNDFLNSDNINNTTTKGTQQDSSNLWHTIIDKAIEMCINGIIMLSSIAPVDVVYAVSNHDYHSMYGVMNVLKAYFKDTDCINIDTSPKDRKYIKLDKVLIGISHDLKPEKGLEIMSVEAHDKWSDCTTMIWFLGHLHTQMSYTKKGYLEIFRLPTVSGWSRWTTQKGYVQSDKRNQSFIIDGENGIRTVINTVIK